MSSLSTKGWGYSRSFATQSHGPYILYLQRPSIPHPAPQLKVFPVTSANLLLHAVSSKETGEQRGAVVENMSHYFILFNHCNSYGAIWIGWLSLEK